MSRRASSRAVPHACSPQCSSTAWGMAFDDDSAEVVGVDGDLRMRVPSPASSGRTYPLKSRGSTFDNPTFDHRVVRSRRLFLTDDFGVDDRDWPPRTVGVHARPALDAAQPQP